MSPPGVDRTPSTVHKGRSMARTALALYRQQVRLRRFEKRAL